MAQLAIRGHATRGKEVIEILEMFGGRNTKPYLSGNVVHQVYHIRTCNNEIVSATYTTYGDLFKVFTLEEFLKKFPYKVGDKVRDAVINDCIGEIISARWDDYENQIIYVVKWDEVSIRTLPYYAIDLQPYKEETVNGANKVVFEANAQCCDIMNSLIKEETMEEKLEQITLDIPKGYEFFGINDDNQVVLAKKQLQYPKTYEECCNVIGYESDRQSVTGYLAELIEKFQQLIICRNAYWKIAGEQMGLGKPWEPDFTNDKPKYCFYVNEDVITYDTVFYTNYILSFPTIEIRDAFKENFDEDIDACKEFL